MFWSTSVHFCMNYYFAIYFTNHIFVWYVFLSPGRFLSTGSVLVTFAALYRMRRPIKLFLLQFRLLGLVVLLPVCMHVLLELMDRRVSWRLYRIYTHGVDGVASIGSVRAKSVDIRFWVLYVVVPGLYLSTCYILGRYHS